MIVVVAVPPTRSDEAVWFRLKEFEVVAEVVVELTAVKFCRVVEACASKLLKVPRPVVVELPAIKTLPVTESAADGVFVATPTKPLVSIVKALVVEVA